MRYPPPDTYDRYIDQREEDDFLSLDQPLDAPAMAGLPESWRRYDWWLGGLAFTALWMTDSWMLGIRLQGMSFVNHLAQDLWCVLLALTLCGSVFHFCKHRMSELGPMPCILTAAAMLAGRIVL